jgi:hypothetical protein
MLIWLPAVAAAAVQHVLLTLALCCICLLQLHHPLWPPLRLERMNYVGLATCLLLVMLTSWRILRWHNQLLLTCCITCFMLQLHHPL